LTLLVRYGRGLIEEMEKNRVRHTPTRRISAPSQPVAASTKPGGCIEKIWTSQELDRPSRSSVRDGWNISYPNSNPYDGIGWIVEPEEKPSDVEAVALHDAHREQGKDYTPDPAIDWVMYQFSAPITVHEVKVRQHHNGIMRIAGELGDTETSFKHSLGSATGQGKHDVALDEGFEEVFQFKAVSQDHPPTGKFLRLTITETVNAQAAWAVYRLIPRDAGHQPLKPCGIGD
jgi:hypothetical protein